MTIGRIIELLKIEQECILRNTNGICDRRCGECDLVQDDAELNEMYTDVIALLKAQEPKLLSVEEVVGYVVLGRDKTLWFEFRDGIKEMNAKEIGYNDFICDEDCPRLNDPNLVWRVGKKYDGVIIAEYNDTFRCWTSCPTDEQRKEVKWEDEKY